MDAKLVLSLPLILFTATSGPAVLDDCQQEVKVAYTATQLRLRTRPSPSAPVVLTLPRAARVTLGECDEGWCQVDYLRASDGFEFYGYAAEVYLAKNPPDTGAVSSQANAPKAQARSCCKICKKGKACGDSCINRNYTCRKGPGCACNG